VRNKAKNGIGSLLNYVKLHFRNFCYYYFFQKPISSSMLFQDTGTKKTMFSVVIVLQHPVVKLQGKEVPSVKCKKLIIVT
jgi:hypothetical protein